MDSDKLMNTEDAAHYLSMSPGRIRYETFIKRIPFIKIGRSVRFSKKDLDAWISSQSTTNKDVNNIASKKVKEKKPEISYADCFLHIGTAIEQIPPGSFVGLNPKTGLVGVYRDKTRK